MAKAFKIEPQEWYSLNDIHKYGMFHWVRSISAIRRFVLADAKGKNILKALITGKMEGKKYRFKGENIINYVKAVEDGKVVLR